MRGTLFAAGLCLFVVAAAVGGLAPQLWPSVTQSTTLAVALTVGVLVAVALAVIISQDGEINR
jgi:hypothetical protein